MNTSGEQRNHWLWFHFIFVEVSFRLFLVDERVLIEIRRNNVWPTVDGECDSGWCRAFWRRSWRGKRRQIPTGEVQWRPCHRLSEFLIGKRNTTCNFVKFISQISERLREDDPEEVNVRRNFRVGAFVLEGSSLESSESIEGREDKLEEPHGKLMRMFSRAHWKRNFHSPERLQVAGQRKVRAAARTVESKSAVPANSWWVEAWKVCWMTNGHEHGS